MESSDTRAAAAQVGAAVISTQPPESCPPSASGPNFQLDGCKAVVKQEENVPKFAGDSEKFREWYEQFESIVAACSALEKCRKLEGALVGDALKAIAHITLSEDQFETAMAIVQEVFGSVFAAQYAHVVNIMRTCSGKTYRNTDE